MKPIGVFGPLGDAMLTLLLWSCTGIFWIADAPWSYTSLLLYVSIFYTFVLIFSITMVFREVAEDIKRANDRVERMREGDAENEEEPMGPMTLDEFFEMVRYGK